MIKVMRDGDSRHRVIFELWRFVTLFFKRRFILKRGQGLHFKRSDFENEG